MQRKEEEDEAAKRDFRVFYAMTNDKKEKKGTGKQRDQVMKACKNKWNNGAKQMGSVGLGKQYAWSLGRGWKQLLGNERKRGYALGQAHARKSDQEGGGGRIGPSG